MIDPRSLCACALEHVYDEHDEGCERDGEHGPPDEDVGYSPAGRVHSDEDRDGDSADDDRNDEQRATEFNGFSHQTRVCLTKQRHFLSPLGLCR